MAEPGDTELYIMETHYNNPELKSGQNNHRLFNKFIFYYRVSVFNSKVCISSCFFSLPCVGMVDNSGIRFTVTPTLRQHDAGILEFTAPVDTNLVIPPHQSNFVSSVYCNESTVTEVCLYYTQSFLFKKYKVTRFVP